MTTAVLSGSCCLGPADSSREPAGSSGSAGGKNDHLQRWSFRAHLLALITESSVQPLDATARAHSPSSGFARWFEAVGRTCRYRNLLQRAKLRTRLRRPSSACLRRFSHPLLRRAHPTRTGRKMVTSSKELEAKIQPVTTGQLLLSATCKSRMSPELRWCASRGRSSGRRRN